MECMTEGCSRKVHCRGVCDPCYHRFKYHGTLDQNSLPSSVTRNICSQDECFASVVSMGVCSAHYQVIRGTERSDLISLIKLNAGCMDCGYDLYACVLDFDHRDGEQKLFTIGKRPRVALGRLLAEIAKCDVVCSNCHRIRTEERAGRDPRKRGSTWQYR